VRILITGAAGMLGSGLVPELIAQGHDVVATDIDLRVDRPWGESGPQIGLLDVRDGEAVRRALDTVEPDLVAHLAAETDLERSELDPDHAWQTNAIATKHVALATRDRRIPVAYISTAGVFNGAKDEPYTEYDDPDPLMVYGRSKLEGERYIQWFAHEWYVIRAGWMVGGGARKDHKFVARMLDQIRAGATVLHAVDDKLGTPTYVPDFARTFAGLVEARSYGLYHMACEGMGSRFDVAARILEVLGLTDKIALEPVSSEFFAEQFWAPRPRSEILRNLVLELQGLNQMRPWRDALEDYLRREFADLAVRQPAVTA
jgi:dTDP-4-dehydrorhamnose reductase